MTEIRPIRIEDAESYRACLDRVAHERVYIAFTEAPSAEQARFFIANMLKRGLPFVVACDGDDVVGWCDIHADPPSSTRPGFSHVGRLGMGLDQGYRGHRLGESLLRAAIEQAGHCGLERVELQVFASNMPAIALYRKFGFETEGTRRRARKLDDRYDDIIMMARLRPPSQD
ncbi:N-acetyltransferase family protein [Ferrovibrio sp.]|uniref:GNAT family N-acetyltransferase n=1 Tax=Ferrovibrio sp. TaxID=1917215 RepID=UPI0035AEA526